MSPVRLPGFTWDPASQRYRGPDGRYISRERVRIALDQAITKKTTELKALANELRAGRLTVDAWAARTRELVKDVNLYSAAAAKGGWAQMTATDYGIVGQAVKKQYAYLDRFAADIDAGLPLNGQFFQRAASYAKSGRVLYGRIVSEAMDAAGFDSERNQLGVADHCDGCLVETARGWVPLGALIPIGQRTCLGNCECFIQYRRARDGVIN